MPASSSSTASPAGVADAQDRAALPASSSEGPADGSRRRQECPRCLRPQRVCLCAALPQQPLRLRGRVVILQHPHELKKRLATVPLLRACLDPASLEVVTGRKLPAPESDPSLDSLLSGPHPVYVLFPGPAAADLAERCAAPSHGAALEAAQGRQRGRGEDQGAGQGAARASQHSGSAGGTATSTAPVAPAGTAQGPLTALREGDVGRAEATGGGGHEAREGGAEAGASSSASPQAGLPGPAYALVVIDGTWKQAKEMAQAVVARCLPPDGPGIQAALRPEDVLPSGYGGGAGGGSGGAGGGEGGSRGAQEGVDGEAGAGAPGPAGSGPTPGPPAADPYHPAMPCLIRKEPVPGFVTTFEATARAVGLLERSPALGEELLAPLRLMTRLQAVYSPAVHSRMLGEPEPPKQQQRKVA
ncbi:hypothetical protein HYH03_006894 [Edaphochlamys debaryana]|uniref:tRNA-uridine aminocarboxypropyltransferase n=1 Tax=Edaphochlamys debaryana TaxID=47281 RepID=A0A835YCF5_9CHLO|nr:hypothetical protein HYH03_006894 [Edaphochlamys debaryana]|eukprot:KAG2494959.1 hypothetical protein HYH03_006894 [Edaphochlamys debaryana]